MEQCEENSQENDDVIIEKEISKLIEEQRLFTESIYACLPVGIEIYDAHGVLRSINDHALRMYGVDDRTSVVNIVNLYKSPFVDSELLARIQSTAYTHLTLLTKAEVCGLDVRRCLFRC